MMGKKHLAAALLLLTPWILAGCALLPQEEAPRSVPLLSAYNRIAYETEAVIRETLVLQKNVSCKYEPVQSDGLSFQVGGEYIDEILVSVGDHVEAGQVLAYLNLSDIQERLEAAREGMEETQLRLSYLDKTEKLALKRCELEHGGSGRAQLAEAREQVLADYAGRRRKLEDQKMLQALTLDRLEQEKNKRMIIAPYEGTMTYVRTYEEGEMSTLGERVMTLADDTLSLFRAETPYWEYFIPGDTWEITVSKNVYEATVADEAELGLTSGEKIPGEKADVYFRLKEPTFELEDGDSGRITLILDVYEDVLTLSEDALASIGDQMIVYYVKEDGTRGYKPVETGITVDGRTHIISGVSPGELVVTD